MILDVVHNHIGASGRPGAGGVRAVPDREARDAVGHGDQPRRRRVGSGARVDPAVAEQWIRDFHVDGLRLDAVHALGTPTPSTSWRRSCAASRAANPDALVIAESGLNDPKVMRPDGGWGCDAAWADDFHHALHVALTGETDGWYEEFADIGTLVKAFGRPHVHDGSYSSFRARRFGAPADDIDPEHFVVFSSNHDQVGNRAFGDRPAAATRPLAALLTAWRRSRRCCSRARSTASARRSSSSATTSTPRSPGRRARAGGTSSPRSSRSGSRCRIRRTRARSSARS